MVPVAPMTLYPALVPYPETSVSKRLERKLSPWNAAAKVTGKCVLAAA